MISDPILDTICKSLDLKPEQVTLYPSSYTEYGEGWFILCKASGVKKILAMGEGDFFSQLNGTEPPRKETELYGLIKLCPLSHENRLVLNQYLSYTRPTAFGRTTATIGLGDRLGLSTQGHVRCFTNSKAKPILAQQSRRELDLTGRDFKQVLDDVCFAVLQEGYRGGFGADGDHLKKAEDIREALDSGYTMITLDCSERIGRGIEKLDMKELAEAYERLPKDYRARIENFFLSRGFPIGEEEYIFSKEELMRCALIYGDAVDFITEIYSQYLKKAAHAVDFELSIDETESITTAQGHLFVAMELADHNVEVTSLAPRFVGQFQKGIDYIGDMDAFEAQLKQHAAIAQHFGYKLSIHSGSDKFSIFPMIGQYTGGLLHIKTSGTTWLEAVATIAEKNPLLYRKIHQKALEHFEEAKNFYYVTGDPSKVEDPAQIADDALISYLENDDSRQLLHITYGYVLEDAALKKEIYQTLETNEEHFWGRLISHIGRHLELIKLTRKEP